jgi:hypothetical protein
MKTDKIEFRLIEKPKKEFLQKLGFKEISYKSENLGKICSLHYMSKIVSTKTGRIRNYFMISFPNYFTDRDEQIRLEVYACTKEGKKLINYKKIKLRGEGESSRVVEIPSSAKEWISPLVISYVFKFFGCGSKKSVDKKKKK